MIDNFKIEINDNKKINKIKKSNLIVRLSILGAFLLTVLITAIVVFVGGEKRTVFMTGEGGTKTIDFQEYFYQEIQFANLKDDGSTETIHASDFKVVIEDKEEDKECVGVFISTGNVDNASTEYELVHDGKTKFVKVYFERNPIQNTSFEYGVTYKDKFLGSYMTYSNKAYDFWQAFLVEFFVFGIAFAIVSARLSARLYAKNGERYKAINEQVITKLKASKFNTTKTFALSGRKSGVEDIEKMLVFVDGKNKKLALVDYDKLIYKVVDYKDIISYKIIEKNGTDVNSQLQYSILLDTAFTTTSSRDVCKKLQLVFVLNDEDDATLIYELVKSSLGMDTEKYKQLSKEMIDITAFLDIVEKNTPKDKRFIYCKHCGTKNDYDAKNCSSCGAAID